MATTTTELQTLDINLLSKAQYDALVEAGTIDENALYFTPEEAGSYSDLTDKPSINGVTLSGNKTTAELGINSAVWGNISGTLSNQTDLQSALNTKLEGVSVNGTPLTVTDKAVNVPVPTKTSDLTNDGSTGSDPFATQSEVAAVDARIDDIIAEGGEPNVIVAVQQNGVALPITNKTVNVTVPTATSDLTNDSNFVTQTELDTKVDKVTGKGLSTHDFTTAEQTKLADIESGAQVNVIESVSQNGTPLTITNKNVDVTVPTKTSDLFNDGNGDVDSEGNYYQFVTSATTDNISARIDGIVAEGGEPNLINTIQKNGVDLPINHKTVNIVVPTKLSDLTNDNDTVEDASYVHTDNNFTTALKNKLDGIAAGAEVNVQSDWNESDANADSFIRNKPTVNDATLTIQKNGQTIDTFSANASTDVTVNFSVPNTFSHIQVGETQISAEVENDTLTLNAGANVAITPNAELDSLTIAAVYSEATTGTAGLMSAADKTKLDSIAAGAEVNVQANWAETTSTSDAYIQNKPTKVSDFTNDAGFGTITEVTAGSGLIGGGTTGSISLGHSNSITAQTTSGLYPIKIDAQGHITEYGEALDLHEMVILRYGVSTWSDFIDAYKHNAIVYCRASSNSNPASGSQTRMAFMAYVNNADNPTNVEFQYYRSVSSHTFDLQGDEVYIYKLESNNTWSVTVRKAYSKVDTEKGLAHTFSGGTSSVVKLKANLQSETQLSNDAAAATEVAGRVYPVALDKSGYLAVNVPWTNSVNDVKVNGTSILSSGVADLITNTAYDSTDNKIATMSDVSSMGTVKSVQVAATGPIQSSQDTSQTETLSTTISLADAYGDTKNPYGSKTKNFVLAAPSNANGTPSFRALTTADIPNITVSKISDFPTIPSKTSDLTNDSDFVSDASYVHTDNNFTTTLKNKLDGIAAGAEVNVQADWNETDSTSDAYIKNKPSIPEGASAGTTVTAVGTTAVVGTSTSFAREDHVHNITSSTITSALGFTPYDSTNPNGYQTASQVSAAVAGEATLRTNADADLQSQIDALSASSDVVDVVGTYADLQDYDTTALHNNDIIKVLDDSTHDNSIGYFRWVITGGTGSWSYIGAEGPYYTVAETDALLGDYVPTSRKVGAVDLSANVTLSGSFSGTSKSISVSGTPTGNITISKGTGTANYTPSGSNAKSAVTISPTTTSVYSITSVGSKTDGTAASFTQGEDSFTANTPTVIDTSKFSGGSFTRGAFSGGSFTQGTDSFTANVPTKIDTTKFSGGSFTRGSFSGGSFTQGTDSFVAPVLTFTPNSSTGNLTISWSAGSFVQGSDSYTAATHDADSFTAASLGTGFYTAGSAATFTQGSDSFTAATHGNDNFTAAKLNSGFYTAGTAASFSQGEDEFTANTPTSVTLPERSQVTGLWNGYNTGADNTYAAAQTFTGDGAELKGTFSGTSFTSTGTYKPEGSVTVTASH